MKQVSYDVLERQVGFAKQGDQQAFATLVQQTMNATTAIALSIVKDVDASEDVAQQAYIKIWKQLPSLQKNQSFLPWLRQITRYTAMNYLRDAKSSQRLSSQEADALFAATANESEDGLEQLDRQQMNELLSNFIDDLPSEFRELVLLYYREEQSTQHVAQLLDITEVNVRKKLSRARQLLKAEWLAKHGKLVLSTAPGIGFTSLVTGLISSTSPVAAATMATSVSSTQTSVITKLVAILGGALIGGALAIAAVLFSTRQVLKNIKDESFRPKILRARNLMIGWIGLCSVLFAMSYEFTTGWWAPTLCYSLFAIGLVRLLELTQLLTTQAGVKQASKWCIDTSKRNWKTIFFNWLGPVMGGIGLLSGLYNSGRFFG